MSDKNIDNSVISTEMENINKLYTELKLFLGERHVSTENLIEIVFQMMKIVEGYKNLSGEQKKSLIVKVLTKILEEQLDNLELNHDTPVLKLSMQLIPYVIDKIIGVDKGKIFIKQKKQCKFFC